jgi:hypothetical protein
MIVFGFSTLGGTAKKKKKVKLEFSSLHAITLSDSTASMTTLHQI